MSWFTRLFRRAAPPAPEPEGYDAPPSKPHPDTGYVMTPDEQRIYDWLRDATHRDTNRALPAASLVEFRNAIAAGRHRHRRLCLHCHKPLDTPAPSSWGTARWKVHEHCREDMFEKRAELGDVGSGAETLPDYLVDKDQP